MCPGHRMRQGRNVQRTLYLPLGLSLAGKRVCVQLQSERSWVVWTPNEPEVLLQGRTFGAFRVRGPPG